MCLNSWAFFFLFLSDTSLRYFLKKHLRLKSQNVEVTSQQKENIIAILFAY